MCVERHVIILYKSRTIPIKLTSHWITLDETEAEGADVQGMDWLQINKKLSELA